MLLLKIQSYLHPELVATAAAFLTCKIKIRCMQLQSASALHFHSHSSVYFPNQNWLQTYSYDSATRRVSKLVSKNLERKIGVPMKKVD